ncbi:MAG: LacI family DNA-binding transcriptional regulator [Firmicutes bacterium]|nr:LacI family DNA-binding transcriptional regulator [Bacillota bacterium]
MVTIKDVAKRAGVSVTAVSRALNDYPDISPETKARILAIVRELRYYPSAVARNLVTRKSRTMGVFYSPGEGLRHPFVGHVMNVFMDCIGDMGYDLMLFANKEEPLDEWGFLDRVRHREIDGVLLIGTPRGRVDGLVQSEIPVVGLDFVTSGRMVGSVTSDNRRSIQSLIGRLNAVGYRKIGFIHGPLHLPVAMERLQGFYAGMAEIGLPARSEWIFDNGFSLSGGKVAAESLLAMRERPEVMVCSSDVSAIGVMQVMHVHHVQVPDQMGVVGFDDIDAAAYVSPQLTTIAQDIDAMALAAASMLIDMIEAGPDASPRHLVLPTRLVERATTRSLTLDAPR